MFFFFPLVDELKLLNVEVGIDNDAVAAVLGVYYLVQEKNYGKRLLMVAWDRYRCCFA